jgi:hypothetical protein
MSTSTFDVVCRFVPGLGWLGLLVRLGDELYRTGRFWPDAEQALDAVQRFQAKVEADRRDRGQGGEA